MIYILLSLFAVLLIYKIVDMVRVKNMTYEKLLEKCYKLIDACRVSSITSTLMRHPKLLVLHFNDLQNSLTEYARAVEEKNNKN